jgi:thiamine pyrophosphate-dependent acetolactate synthase large subunit-like protein
MGFGLPSALGAAATNPGIPVIDIDGDGSFLMNIQAAYLFSDLVAVIIDCESFL